MMQLKWTWNIAALVSIGWLSSQAWAADPYKLDPTHTFVSFAADHMGGLSIWRGKFNKSRGQLTLDLQTGKGSVEAEVDIASINTGHGGLDRILLKEHFFAVKKYPKAVYQGHDFRFVDGAPAEIRGELTLHGLTRPLTLKVQHFKCMVHPLLNQKVCGAELTGNFNRADFGLDYGKAWGFKMDVDLNIQVEAIRQYGNLDS